MFDEKFENKVRNNAGEIFGHAGEPSAGHRERFEQRLKKEYAKKISTGDGMTVAPTKRKSRMVVTLKIMLVAVVANAAVIAGFIVLINSQADKSQGTELADVRNYYNMRLEEMVDATKLLVQNIDEEDHKKFLLDNIEHIENITVPDVQVTDDEYVVLIANVYTDKIEALQNMQNILKNSN